MKVEIKVPSLGESITEAIIAHILIPSGTFVNEGAEIVEIETDKVNQVLYAPKSGVVTLNVKKDQKVAIDEVIGFIDTDAKVAQTPPVTLAPAAKPAPATPKEEARVSSTTFVSSLDQEALPSSPKKKEAPLPSGATRTPMSSLRKKIATKLVEVKNTTAMLTTFNEIDMSSVIDIRSKEQENFQKRYGIKLGFMSFFIKATVAALKAIPQVNAMIDNDSIVSFSTYDIGVAVSTERGLMVPVLKGCDKKSFGELEKELADFAKKAREGGITVDDLRGGSFTITNGGVFGSLLSTPIINPPQSAILGMHAIVKRPIAIQDEIVIRPMMYIALSYDHRLIDGKEAVQFLVSLKQNLEDPSRLLLDL